MSLQDSYYDFISKTPLKGVAMAIENAGIPSLPVFILIILLIIGGAGFLIYSSLQSSHGVYAVNVLSSSGSPVSGAMVSVSYQGNTITNYTDDNGNAAFPGIPSNALASVTVNATGFSFYSKSSIPSGAPTRLETVPASITLNVQSTGSAPIPNANILYQVGGGNIQTTVTDGNGNAVLTVSLNSQVTGTVSASGYQTNNFSFTASQQSISESVVLNAITSQVNNQALMQSSQDQNVISSPVTNTSGYNTDSNNNFNNNASVSVSVSDQNGNPLNASVSLLLNGSSNSFSAILASNGTAVFSVGVGSTVYATASLDGYASASSIAGVVSASGLSLSVALTPINYENTTNVTVSVSANSSNGTIPVDGSVYLWTYPSNSVVYQSSSYESNPVINIPVGTIFRVGVYSSGYVAQISPLEYALNSSPLIVNFSMVNATLQNSFTLNVSTVDFYSNPVPGSYVSINDKGVAFPLDIQNYQTDFNGNISITGLPLPINGFSVSAFSGAFSGKTVLNSNSSVNGTVSATVVLLPPITTVKVEAYSFDGIPLNASFSSYFIDLNNQPHIIDSCFSTAPSTCSLKVFTGVSLVIQASSSQSPGYLSSIYSSQFNPIDNYFQNFTLYPTNSPLIENFQVFGPCNWNDSYTSCSKSNAQLFNASTGNLTVGGKYYAVFKLNVNPASDHYGVYFLTGNSSGDVLSDNAALLKFPQDMVTHSSSDVFNPAYFNVTGDSGFNGGCGSQISPSQTGFLKWVEAAGPTISSLGSYTANMVVPFMMTGSSPEGLNIYYRAFETSNGSYLRDPFDSRLNTSASAPGVSECNAAVYTQRFHVINSSNSETLCSDQACLNVYCEINGDLNTKNSCYNTVVNAFSYQGDVLNVFYNVLDMNPDNFAGTTLSVGSSSSTGFDSNYLTLLNNANFTPSNSGSSLNNIVNQTLYNTTGSGVLTLTNNGNASTQNIVFTYGSKLSFTTNVTLTSAPVHVSLLPSLPSGYVVNYNSTKLNLDFLNGSPASNIQFYSDPIMPADAVFLVLNQSSVNCGQGILASLTNLSDQCVSLTSIQNDPLLSDLSSYLKAWGGSVYVLRYDPTNPACSAFSINPNLVNNFNGNDLSAANLCNGVFANFSIQANSTSTTSCSVTGGKSNGYCAVTYKPVWSEQAMSSSINPAGGTNNVNVLINNRVYSLTGSVPLNNTNGGVFNNPQISPQKQIILPNQGSFFTLSSMNNNISLPLINVSSSTSPPPAFDPKNSIPADSSSDFADLITLSSTSFYGSALAVLNNTAFRRALPSSFGTPLELSAFPYSAFASVNNTNLTFAFGADWLGKSGSGGVDFSFAGVNTTNNCSIQNQRGVYGLNLVYSPSNGTINIQASPLTFGMQNDFAHLQNVPVQMCGTMSFNPATNNFQNTGDGWYYSASPGTGGTLSDGHQFNVNQIHAAYDSSTFLGVWTRNLAEQVGTCIASAGAAGLTCYSLWNSGNSPYTAYLKGAAVPAFVAGFYVYEQGLNSIVANLNQNEWKLGDTYDASSWLGSLQAMCSVASPILGLASTAYDAYTQGQKTSNAFETMKNDKSAPCGALTVQAIESNCLCYSGGGLSGTPGSGGNTWCVIGSVTSAMYSSQSFSKISSNQQSIVGADNEQVKTDTAAVATAKKAVAAAKTTNIAAAKTALATADKKLNTDTATQTQSNSELTLMSNVDKYRTILNGVCQAPLYALSVLKLVSAASGESRGPYVGIGITGSGADSTLSIFEQAIGSTTAKGDLDCSNWMSGDFGSKFNVWDNLDLVSLRGFNSETDSCHAASNIKVYTKNMDVNGQTATFYISSKLQ